MNLTAQVRAHCKEICENLTLISVNEDLIERYASSIDAPPQTAPSIHNRATPDDLERGRLLVLALDTINFGSGWHDIVTKRLGLSGARTMAAALVEFDSTSGPLDPDNLRRLDVETCARVFGQSSDAMELMSHFSDALAELASLLDNYGSAERLIAGCDGSAVALAERLTEMPMFDDVGFFKRAQIAAADLARDQLANFDDLAELTAFADNLVPHVLAVDGIITVSAELAGQIGKGELLEPGGRAEAELRAAAVHIVEMITAATSGLRAMDVDQALWERGGQLSYKRHRRPRCRSIYY